MKWITPFLIFVMLSASAQAQSKIVARISNARNDKGVCEVCLFNSPATFNGDSGSPVQCLQSPVTNGQSEARFENVAPGTYAVMVFHDVNSNKKMDKNFIGIPKEGYGASQNKLPFAAAPTFDENKFAVGANTITTLHIRLRNL